jgi:hypothetical protein
MLPFQHSQFNGHLTFDDDSNAYYAFMNQSKAGQWLFYNPFTPEKHKAVFFNLEFLIVGKLAALTGISLEVAVQIVRIFSIFVLCFSFYWLSSFLFTTSLMRRIVFIMVMLGGGFGWLCSIPYVDSHFRSLFYDNFAGVHPFFSMLLAPHFLIAQAFAVLTLCLFMRAEHSRLQKDYVLAALCCLIVGTLRPYDLLYLMTAFTLYIIVTGLNKTSSFFSHSYPRLLVIIVPLPLIAYYLWLFKVHPVFRWWSIQGKTPPPFPSCLVISLGISFVLLVFGMVNWGGFKEKAPSHTLITCCFFSSMVLIYSYPALLFALQFSTTLLIPTVLVGTMKIERTLVSMVRHSKWVYVGITALLVVNSLTSFNLLRRYIRDVYQGKHRTETKLLTVYQWLDNHSEPQEIVLATSLTIANQIPRYTHNTTFCGWHFNTVNFNEKKAMFDKFFKVETSDTFRKDFLKNFNIRYIFFSTDKPYSNTSMDPRMLPFLKEIFRNDIAIIYRVMML